MYGGGMAALEDAAKRQEEHLMGKPVQLSAQEEVTRVERSTQLATVNASALPQTQNENWQRLNNDPLLMIKRQEQESMKRIRQNPVQMQEIIKQVQEMKSKKKDKKDKKK